MSNLESSVEEIATALQMAAAQNRLVRLHVGGDFSAPDGELDQEYITDWLTALVSLQHLPKMLCYTHCIDTFAIPAFFGNTEIAPNFKLFASVHGPEDLTQAETSGFTRYALTMEEKTYEWKGGAWLKRFGKRWLVCPEQRGKIKDCDSCRYCWRDWGHGGHVAFLEHSQPPNRKQN